MIQNILGYSLELFPAFDKYILFTLAAGVLFSAGILISPALGAVLMSLNIIIVAINAQFLKREMKK